MQAGALLAIPLLAQAQRPSKTHRIGFFAATTVDDAFFPRLPDELRKLGYEEGRNAVFEVREAKRAPESVPALAESLVAAKPDVIVADLPRQIVALRRVTATIPIVMTFGMVPEELGLIKSMRRPGGNVTGTLLQGPESAGKTLQIVREILPREARFAMLYERDYPGLDVYIGHWERSAASAGLLPSRIPVSTDADLDVALARIAETKTQAMSVTPTGVVARRAIQVLRFASDRRIAVVAPTKWMVEQGALLAFEADLALVLARAAAIVDKILKGASPAEIPVEEPTKFELWLNIKAADALGLSVPAAVRLQAHKIYD